MRDKNIAAILALLFGGFGVHRFYLGQIGLGILYIFFFWISWLIGFIDFIVFLSMDQEEFDFKYNRKYFREERARRYNTDFDRRHPRYDRSKTVVKQPVKRKPAGVPKNSPFRESGIKKFKEYDYEGAIKDFEKAVSVNPKDVAAYFNLACACSLTENTEKALRALDMAVKNGFKNFEKIQEHDALAYLRIQEEFDAFVENGYQLAPQLQAPKENLLDMDLLDQLNKLGELKEKGLLTEEEFLIQKKKLLG